MSKTLKILMTILVIAMITIIPTMSMAAPTDKSGEVDKLFNQNVDAGEITTVGGKIVSIVTTVAIVVAVIVLLVLGIKYMMGSASEKAEYKKTMIPYLVGSVLVFGAAAIAKAIIAATQNITAP